MSSLLPWLIFLPVLGGLLCWVSEGVAKNAPKWIGMFTMIILFALTIYLWVKGGFHLDLGRGADWQYQWQARWIPTFGVSFHLALDGLSILMVALSALLGIFAIWASWKEQYKQQGLFYFNLLLTTAGVMGVFLAIDLFLFFFCWELMIIPMYFMIAFWGHKQFTPKQRFSGATKFLIYTQSSGLIMLMAIFGLVMMHYMIQGVWTFDYNKLLATDFQQNSIIAYILMLGFFIAFAVKMPTVPFHGWLADAHAEAPTAGSIDISGLLLKTGAYGLLRFSLTLFPVASSHFAPIAMVLGLVSLFYGAWLAYGQSDLKRLVAYTSISHMGIVLIAIYSASELAYQGAVMQMIAHGFSAAALFIISGMLYRRLGTRDMREMGGLWKRIAYLPAFALFFALATLGLPGTGNFIGEFTMLVGSFSLFPSIVVVAAFGMVFASIYSLVMVHRSFYGAAKSTNPLVQLSCSEFLLIFTLVVLLLILGFYPQIVFDTSYVSMQHIHRWISAATFSVKLLGV